MDCTINVVKTKPLISDLCLCFRIYKKFFSHDAAPFSCIFCLLSVLVFYLYHILKLFIN